MSKIPKPDDMPDDFYARCLEVTAKRARTVIDHILKYGAITTEELSEQYGYDHAPRAARDVRENGIPLKTLKVVSSKTRRKIASYEFDYSDKVRGRIGGRKAFSTQFKARLIEHYGPRNALTNEELHPRYLQIDHRIPYEVAGNDANEEVQYYMLLDASGQRAKSWSCESCKNFQDEKDQSICATCFWAYPENYTHIAMNPERRLEISWQGDDCIQYENLIQVAENKQITPQNLVKMALKKLLLDRK